MCEEFEEEYEQSDDEFDYALEDEPPSKPKYYPASPPTPLATRLAYYKYDLKFRKFCSDLHKLFTRLEFGADKQPKKKLLCVRLGTKYFVLDPKCAEQKTPFTEVEFYGAIQRFPSAPPNITLTTHVIAANEKDMWRKYEYLRKHFHESLYATICGERWYASTLDCSLQAGSAIEIGFQLPSDVKQMMHQRLRENEAKHKERFAKFAALT